MKVLQPSSDVLPFWSSTASGLTCNSGPRSLFQVYPRSRLRKLYPRPVNLAESEGQIFAGWKSINTGVHFNFCPIAFFGKSTMTALLSRLRISFSIAFVAVSLFGHACLAQAPAVATGDTRTVTEPVFPSTCQTLLASFHDVNEDVPLAVETGNTSLDVTRLQAALNACQGTNQAVELSIDGSGNNAFLTGPISIP